MEDIQLHTVFGSSLSIITAIITICALSFKLVSHLVRAFEWHDRYLVRKRLSELESVRNSTEKLPLFTQYIDDALAVEGFRIASGITTSPKKMNFLMQLSKEGVWTNAQLRSASKYLSVAPGAEEPVLTIGFADLVGATLGLIAALGTLTLGGVYFLQMVFAGKPVFWLFGLGIFLAFLLATRLFITDFIDYKVVKRIHLHERLKKDAV